MILKIELESARPSEVMQRRVLSSNLSKYITPELGIQLLALKQHLGIEDFAYMS